MNAKEAKFCEEYVKTGNARASAVAAGYAPATAGRHAYRWVIQFKPYIDELRAKAVEIAAVEPARVLREMSFIAFSNRSDLETLTYDPKANKWERTSKQYSEMTRDQIASIQDVEMKNGMPYYKTWDKVAALKAIAQIMGMVNSKLQIQHRYENLNQTRSFADVPTEVLEKLEQELKPYLPAPGKTYEGESEEVQT